MAGSNQTWKKWGRGKNQETQRPTKIPENGRLCVLLCSDPGQKNEGWSDSD